MKERKRKDSFIVRGIRVNSDDEFLSRFSDVCSCINGSGYTLDNFHCIDQGRGMYRIKVADASVRLDLLGNSSI